MTYRDLIRKLLYIDELKHICLDDNILLDKLLNLLQYTPSEETIRTNKKIKEYQERIKQGDYTIDKPKRNK